MPELEFRVPWSQEDTLGAKEVEEQKEIHRRLNSILQKLESGET